MLKIIQMAYHLKKTLSKGVYHDLKSLYEEVNEKYFDGAIQAEIVWGRFGRYSARRRHMRLGSYCYSKKRIVIHPALDRASVPALCLARVIHHEMLHQKFPVTHAGRQRRCIHGPVFKAAESQFEDALIADLWFKENLGKLLR